MENSKTKIILGGYIVSGPLGGLVWHHFQYIFGFYQLGFDILFVEDSDDYASCYDPAKNQLTTDCSYGISFIAAIFSQYGLSDRWAYFDRHTNKWFGQSYHAVREFTRRCDIFINLSGIHPLDNLFNQITHRVFIDTDPVFTQVRHLTDPSFKQLLEAHNSFFSFGENIGKPNCTVPDDKIKWIPTRQPVVSEFWLNSAKIDKNANWTTVMQWDSYRARTYNGVHYGMKSVTFDHFFLLPERHHDHFELAIGSDSAPKEKLVDAGWVVSNPLEVALGYNDYRNYLLSSKGEWSVAKEGYVKTWSGWFSERSAAYLATGRPVVIQETGFSENIPTGEGLLSFSDFESAINAIESVNEKYELHCRKAREIAESCFRYDQILNSILNFL